jgi:hypothetical protein
MATIKEPLGAHLPEYPRGHATRQGSRNDNYPQAPASSAII